MSDLAQRLRGHQSGAMFINNTGDKAWQRWMRNLLADAQEAADRIEWLEKAVDQYTRAYGLVDDREHLI